VKQTRLALEDQVVALIYPDKLQNEIEALFRSRGPILRLPSHKILIHEQRAGLFSLQTDGKMKFDGLDRNQLFLSLVGEVVQTLISDIDSGVVEHAGALTWNGKGIILPGTTGSGKSSICAWLAQQGFEYLTDECVVLQPEVPWFTALPRPLVMKDEATRSVQCPATERLFVSGTSTIFWPENSARSDHSYSCHLILFPQFERGSQLEFTKLSAAQTALELTTCNVNARNLADHGFGIVTSYALKVPAVKLRYGSFQQLEGPLERLYQLLG
jgi:hypothetical protein